MALAAASADGLATGFRRRVRAAAARTAVLRRAARVLFAFVGPLAFVVAPLAFTGLFDRCRPVLARFATGVLPTTG
jgi:hypothetical protein